MRHVNVSRRRYTDGTHTHTSHVRRRRVSAVRTDRNQADVATGVTTEFVVALDCTQPSIFTLSSAKK